MITIEKVTSNFQSVPRQPPDIYCGLTLTPSVIPNSNCVIMVSDWNCLKYFCVFLYCNYQVHRDVLITLYISHYMESEIEPRYRHLSNGNSRHLKKQIRFRHGCIQTRTDCGNMGVLDIGKCCVVRWQNCEKRLLAWSCLSVCPSAWNTSAPSRRVAMKFGKWIF
jgi:hypothetical protein